jgi:ATP-dependent RNA circularization protein (DNA/RNA ligase family)
MSFNVKTKTVIATPEEQEALLGKEKFTELNEARVNWLVDAVENKKTDQMVSEDGTRNWNSTQSAEEFKSFIENICGQYGVEVTVTVL